MTLWNHFIIENLLGVEQINSSKAMCISQVDGFLWMAPERLYQCIVHESAWFSPSSVSSHKLFIWSYFNIHLFFRHDLNIKRIITDFLFYICVRTGTTPWSYVGRALLRSGGLGKTPSATISLKDPSPPDKSSAQPNPRSLCGSSKWLWFLCGVQLPHGFL